MAYFLKKTKQKNRTYLAIYESFYSHEKKGTAHRTYKSLGSIETLKKNGIVDPVAHYQKDVDDLNRSRTDSKILKIGDKSPLLYLGYFPLKSIMEKLNIENYINLYKHTTDFDFNLYSLLASLVYARSVNPCSKHRTYNEVLPYLFEDYDFNYTQLLDGLSFFGNNYEKIIELFTNQVSAKYGIKTDVTYFDCTNFYFEIDREDDFRKRGPSKQNKKEPLVGMGLLLDSNQIPIDMKLYPGNESEKPILRTVINDLKKQNKVAGKTIHVADKGLNCADNIVHSLKNNDGYLFSKSVKMLPETEKKWVLIDSGWTEVRDKKKKLKYMYKSCVDEFPYSVTTFDAKKKKVSIKEKRLLIYSPSLAKKKKFEINKMIEKAENLRLSQAKKTEYGEAGKYVNFNSTDENGEVIGKAIVTLNTKAIEKDKMFAGYNLLVTSETKMKDEDIYNTYHNLWRIEESFRIMKSDLDARPVYVQKEETIKGHFLICYLTVLLERLFQFHVLDNRYSTSCIFDFIKKFRVVKTDNKYINVTTSSQFIDDLTEMLDLPLNNYFLSETQIKMVLKRKL
jgi:transposase